MKADDRAGLEAAGLDARVVAERLAAHYLAMIFVHGFFHADPHPGNIFVLPGHVLGYVDFGMTGRLDRRLREGLAEAVLAVVERDEAALGRALLSLADYEQEPDRATFEADVAELMDQYAYRPLVEWRLGRMLEQLFSLTAKHRVNVPPELFLMVKTLIELESLTRALDPAFDAVSAVGPFIRLVEEERLAPRRLAETLARAGRDTLALLASAPSDVKELIRQARRGRLLIGSSTQAWSPRWRRSTRSATGWRSPCCWGRCSSARRCSCWRGSRLLARHPRAGTGRVRVIVADGGVAAERHHPAWPALTLRVSRSSTGRLRLLETRQCLWASSIRRSAFARSASATSSVTSSTMFVKPRPSGALSSRPSARQS